MQCAVSLTTWLIGYWLIWYQYIGLQDYSTNWVDLHIASRTKGPFHIQAKSYTPYEATALYLIRNKAALSSSHQPEINHQPPSRWTFLPILKGFQGQQTWRLLAHFKGVLSRLWSTFDITRGFLQTITEVSTTTICTTEEKRVLLQARWFCHKILRWPGLESARELKWASPEKEHYWSNVQSSKWHSGVPAYVLRCHRIIYCTQAR